MTKPNEPRGSGASSELTDEMISHYWEHGYTLVPAVFDETRIQDFLDHKDVLDVGCGWGGKMIYYAENTQLNTIYGFDIPPYKPAVSEAFARSRSLDNCVFTAAYAEDIPYDDNRFDVAIIDDVLEHVQDPEKTVSEAYRVLKSNGIGLHLEVVHRQRDAG